MSIFDQIGKAVQSPMAQGLLGAAAIGFNPAIGLLAAPALAANRKRAEQSASAADLELQERAAELSDNRRRRTAMAQIPRLMSSQPPPVMNMDGSYSQPGMGQFQQRAMGLLGQAAPEAMAQGLLGQVFPQQQNPSALMEKVALFQQFAGRPPNESEIGQIVGAGGDIQDLLGRLQAEEIISGRERRATEESQGEQIERINTEGLVDSGRAIFENLDRLDGTFLEPGSAFGGVRRTASSLLGEGASMLGFEGFAEDRQGEIEALDKLKKDTSDFVVNLAQATGANSATELRQIQDSFAGLESSPAAIRAATSREVARALARADARGIEIPNREGLESLVGGEQSSGGRRRMRFDPATGELIPQ